jgi:hypothetical protein
VVRPPDEDEEDVVKQLIPVPVRKHLRGWLNSAKNTPFAVDLLELRKWQIARKAIGANAAPRNNPRRLVLLPSDPWSIHQSRGDEAMIEAAVGEMKQAHPDIEVYIVTATKAASADVRAMGFKPLEFWRQPFSYTTVAQELSLTRPDFGMVLGADVLDGYYSPVDAARMLLVADLMAACGAKVSVLGFSFNSRPAKALREVFRLLHPGVVLNLRDAISLQRFKDFAPNRAHLVADLGAGVETVGGDGTERLGEELVVATVRAVDLVGRGERQDRAGRTALLSDAGVRGPVDELLSGQV